ncbi:MAG: phage protease [bacterium]
MPIDVTTNSVRIRQRNPDDFERLRTIVLDRTRNIRAVVGRLKGESSTKVQTLIFPKDKFSVEQAKKWAKDHKFKANEMNYVVLNAIEYAADKWQDFLYVGNFDHAQFGKFNITRANLEHALANFKKGIATRMLDENRQGIPTNFNHAHGERNPDNAINSGFITDMRLEGDKLQVKVEWTERALSFIKAGEYKWFSAEFHPNWKDENGVDQGFTITGGALTNIPFLKKNQIPIAADEGSYGLLEKSEERKMDTKKLAVLLGLDEKATDEEIEKALNSLIENSKKIDELQETISRLEEAQKEKTEKEQRKKDDGEEQKQAKSEEKEELAELREQVTELAATIKGMRALVEEGKKAKQQLDEMQARKLVEKALAEKKILPVDVDTWALEQAQKDPAAFEQLIKNRPVVALFEEIGSSTDRDKKSKKPASVEFSDECSKIYNEKSEKDPAFTYADAMHYVSEQNPELYKRYREEIGEK